MKQQTGKIRAKRGLLVLSALLVGFSATLVGVPSAKPAKAADLRATYISYQNMRRVRAGLYETPDYLKIPSNRTCAHIYIQQNSIYSPYHTTYGGHFGDFRVRYYPVGAPSFLDTDAGDPPYYWNLLHRTDESRLGRIGVCVKANTKYKVETDRPMTFIVLD